jgi:hypothetical protein
MSDRAKKFAEFSALTSLEGGDLFLVSDISVPATKKVTLSTLRSAVVRGPYADDAAANTAGVSIGQLYYTAAGDVKVRIA